MTEPPNPPDDSRKFDPTPGRETQFERETAAAAAIAEAVAETEATAVATRVIDRRSRTLTVVLMSLLGVSLLLHALTLSRLFAFRDTIKQEVGTLAESVVAAKNQKLTYDFPIDQQIPVNLSIPVRQSINIPVNTTVRIQQDINIPIDTGFGTVDLPVPLDVNIPISTTVPLEFNQDVPISTTLPVKLSIPIQLDLSSSQFAGYLDRLHEALLRFRDQF